MFCPSLPVYFCPFPNPVSVASVLYCLCNVHQSSKIQADAYATLVTKLLCNAIIVGFAYTSTLFSHTSSYAYPNCLGQDDSSAPSNSTEMSGGDAVAESSTTDSLVEFKEGSSGHKYDTYA